MHMARPPLFLLGLALLGACGRGPSREDALAAIRAAGPGLEGAPVTGRVWQDGPPWFSCAEVSAKIRSGTDSAVVQGQVRNWSDIVASGWATLRDTSYGAVVDPGWCVLRLTPAGEAGFGRWSASPGPLFPTGGPRRGWTTVVGRRAVVVQDAPRRDGDDAALAAYLLVTRPNADGAAVGAARDTARFTATLQRVDGRWRVAASRPAPAPATAQGR
jgi:hypothetical protein